MDHALDRVIWSALTGPHAHLAEGGELARRYPASHSPFGAIAEPSVEALRALVELLPGDADATLVADPGVDFGPDLESTHRLQVLQMVKTTRGGGAAAGPCVALGPADVEAMNALVEATRPGPWRARTHELGRFVGVRVDGELVAMAGERMHLAGACEVSGVCTLAGHRGRGYGALLVRSVTAAIEARGETAFLHVLNDNAGAISVYEALGFRGRKVLPLQGLRVRR